MKKLLLPLLFAASAASAADFRSVQENAAVLYDAPSRQATPLFVVSRSYPLEVIVNLEAWVKVRDHAGALTWIEKKALSDKRMVLVTARSGEKTVFLAEAAQAGIFSVRGIPAEDLEPLLGIGCPTILYPYVREAISDLVTRAGFPAVVLAPVSFEQIYMERRQQAAAGPKIELAN